MEEGLDMVLVVEPESGLSWLQVVMVEALED